MDASILTDEFVLEVLMKKGLDVSAAIQRISSMLKVKSTAATLGDAIRPAWTVSLANTFAEETNR